MSDMLTIRETVQRTKTEGIPISEHALRQWVRTGAVPARRIGRKALIYYPNLVKYLQCADSTNITLPAMAETPGIRRIEI